MNIKIYNTPNGEKVANKTLTQVADLTGDIREGVELYDELVVRVECGLNAPINYAYIGAPYERYYNVTKIDDIGGGVIDLHLQSDVLMSFSSEFENWEGILKRQENKYNLYINDGSFRVYQNPIIIQKSFPNGFAGQEYVLLCGGIPIEHE